MNNYPRIPGMLQIPPGMIPMPMSINSIPMQVPTYGIPGVMQPMNLPMPRGPRFDYMANNNQFSMMPPSMSQFAMPRRGHPSLLSQAPGTVQQSRATLDSILLTNSKPQTAAPNKASNPPAPRPSRVRSAATASVPSRGNVVESEVRIEKETKSATKLPRFENVREAPDLREPEDHDDDDRKARVSAPHRPILKQTQAQRNKPQRDSQNDTAPRILKRSRDSRKGNAGKERSRVLDADITSKKEELAAEILPRYENIRELSDYPEAEWRGDDDGDQQLRESSAPLPRRIIPTERLPDVLKRARYMRDIPAIDSVTFDYHSEHGGDEISMSDGGDGGCCTLYHQFRRPHHHVIRYKSDSGFELPYLVPYVGQCIVVQIPLQSIVVRGDDGDTDSVIVNSLIFRIIIRILE